MRLSKDNLIWIDLEMTGLNVTTECIIEIATIVTDSQLNTIAQGPVIAVSQSAELLDAMDDWCTRQHGQSGLVKRVLASEVTERQTEQATLDFLRQHVPAQCSPMCGNSVHQDRLFLKKYMPELEAYFHYRNLDVSTLKELCHRWAPDIYKGFNKQSKHRALDDIQDSIAELEYYRDKLFKL
jgi:oligoribonuclease